MIVGWSLSHWLTSALVVKALEQAFIVRRVKEGLIFHSDRGSQYASKEVIKLLKEHKCRQSMSGKGNCYDNAVVESFFHTLKTELVHFKNFTTRDEVRLSVFDYIEIFYNRQRRHSTLNYFSPVDFENNQIKLVA
jgi:transposase InsO family protein